METLTRNRLKAEEGSDVLRILKNWNEDLLCLIAKSLPLSEKQLVNTKIQFLGSLVLCILEK